jgi:hypothetical protein
MTDAIIGCSMGQPTLDANSIEAFGCRAAMVNGPSALGSKETFCFVHSGRFIQAERA